MMDTQIKPMIPTQMEPWNAGPQMTCVVEDPTTICVYGPCHSPILDFPTTHGTPLCGGDRGCLLPYPYPSWV